MRIVTYVFWFAIVVLGVTFASLNSSAIEINYYINQSHIHLPILLLITLMLGAFLGVVGLLPTLAKSNHRNRRLRSRVKQVEKEVLNLRTIPIKDEH